MHPFIVTWDFFDWGVLPSRQSGNIICNQMTTSEFRSENMFRGKCIASCALTKYLSIDSHILNGEAVCNYFLCDNKNDKRIEWACVYHTVVLVSSIICRRFAPLGPLMLSWCWIEISICKLTFVWFWKIIENCQAISSNELWPFLW